MLNVEIGEDLLYKPKTKENRLRYEQLLGMIHQALGDEPQDVLRSVTDEVLAILKMDNIRDTDKKTETEALLGPVTAENFSTMLNIAKSINDYAVTAEEENIDKYEEEVRVAVVFDDEEKKNLGEDDEAYEEVAGESDEEERDIVEEKEGLAITKDELAGVEVEDDKYYLDVGKIDAYWLQTELNKYLPDALQVQQMEGEILKILSIPSDIDCENKLVMLLGYDKFDLIKLLMNNRFKIYYCTKLGQAQSEKEKAAIIEQMKQNETAVEILQELERSKDRKGKEEFGYNFKKEIANLSKKAKAMQESQKELPLERITITDEDFTKIPKRILDLENLTFSAGNHLISNDKCTLPTGSWRLQKKGYDEVYVPAVRHKGGDDEIIKISSLPQWAQGAFPGIKEFNRIQSKVFNCAFNSSENMLVCAPTGAGKTNIALLTILHQMSVHRDKSTGNIDLSSFKCIYIAPMKALVTEIVGAMSKKLSSFKMNVRELTGDMQLTKQQIEETQIIVATPEKWDIITRKSGDKAYLEKVKLIIIDEIHLLHDTRGPVLESLVARTIRTIETTQEMIRIVGLSATLPNYTDVAAFIRVKADKGLFYFDNSYRPVPLEQQYIGITEKKAVRRMLLMNEILYEKVIERAGKYQMIVFVHSRKETAKTAKALKEMAMTKEDLTKFLKEDSSSKKILEATAADAKDPELRELLPYGFAIHHAGLDRADRTLVEDLFGDKHVQVLVSTSTLAWGVNLPAHTVIIKGTQIYSPEQGKWVELSPQDVLQMLGRAGRPLYDKSGEGIIITSYQELKFYLSLFNHQLPIESQFISQLADQMNAEIVLGTVNNIRDAVNWLGYTYLYIRMLRNPGLYSITTAEIEEDPLLVRRRTDLVHSAATLLDRYGLIKYDKRGGAFQITALGKIASHYYIKYPSIATFNEHIKPTMGMIELFKVFSLSHEFKYIPIREEEKMEIQKLMETVPLPVKGSPDEPSTKVSILLQAYISRLKLEGFALNADMSYVTQSAGRIMRGLFEIFLRREWASVAQVALNVCKMVDKRMWSCMTPLRQFKNIPEEILRRIEKKEQLTWDHYYNMTPQQIGEVIKFPKLGKTIHKYIHQFPRIEVNATVQPITRSCLKIELTINPDFQWDREIHGSTEPFWIFVEDCDGEKILYYEYFTLKHKHIGLKEYIFEFIVPLFDPLHPLYYIRVVSDRWLQCETVVPIYFKNIILPEKFPPLTELLDLKLLPISSLKWPEVELQLKHFPTFNAIQTQVFTTLYGSDGNVFLGASTGSGKTLCGLLAILRCLKQKRESKIVYVAPLESVCKQKRKEISQYLKNVKVSIGELTGQPSIDSKIMETCDIIFSIPEYWDTFSRRWKQRKVMKLIRLVIVDELHLLGESGSVLEVITSRMRYIAIQLNQEIRLVGLATSIANSRDIAEWIGAAPDHCFNFHPNVRPVPLEIYIQGFDQTQRAVRLNAMGKHIYRGIKQHSMGKPVMVFVSDRKQARITALDLVAMAGADNEPKRFLHISSEEMTKYISKAQERILRHCLEYGVGYIYEGMDDRDRDLVEKLFESGAVQLLVSTYRLCWELSQQSHMVVVMDTQRYDGQERRYIDYTIPDMLQMLGKAGRSLIDDGAKCLIYTHTPKKEFYKKFLYDPFPVESHLNHFFADHLNAEVVAKTIENKQDCIDYLTWTLFYRRLFQNPNYYNLQGVTGTIINDYLSDLVEKNVELLTESKCITCEDDINLAPLNFGIIASYYYIKYTTIDIFARLMNPNFKMKQLLEIISKATEFEIVPIRHGEESLIKQLSTEVQYKTEMPKFNEPNTKTFVLLQCHFGRIPISSDLLWDQRIILEITTRLIQAMVDVISSEGWLKPALLAMQLSQMVVQAMWITDSQLLQLPHFDQALIKKCAEHGVNDLADLMQMEDDEREKLLGFTPQQMEEVAEACNRYPSINMEFKKPAADSLISGESVSMNVMLTREGDETGDRVHAPFYPKVRNFQIFSENNNSL